MTNQRGNRGIGSILLSLTRQAQRLFHWIDGPRYGMLMLVTTFVHLVFIFVYHTHPGVDGVIYQRVAEGIIARGTLIACGAFADAYWPPLFCYYLAGFWTVFGRIEWLFFLFNILIVLLTSLVSWTYLKRAFDERIAYWSTFFFYNSMIVYYFTHYYKYELITALFLALSLALATSDRRKLIGSLAGGFFLGLASLATGRVLVVLPALIYFIFARKNGRLRGKRALGAAFLFIGLVVAIAPWTIRNHICMGRLIPITTNSGMNFYMGFNEKASGSYLHLRQMPDEAHGWDRTDNMTWYRAGLQFIIENPLSALRLMARKLNRLWRVHYADMILFYPFFYVGVFLLARKRLCSHHSWARLMQFIVLLYTIFHMLFIARYYYVLPILPIVYGVAISTYAYLGRFILARLTDDGALRRDA